MSLQNKFLSKELSDKFWKEGLTLATAESCTAGNIAAMITAIPGSSHFYKGGIIAYSDEVKVNIQASHLLMLSDHWAFLLTSRRCLPRNLRGSVISSSPAV